MPVGERNAGDQVIPVEQAVIFRGDENPVPTDGCFIDEWHSGQREVIPDIGPVLTEIIGYFEEIIGRGDIDVTSPVDDGVVGCSNRRPYHLRGPAYPISPNAGDPAGRVCRHEVGVRRGVSRRRHW